MDETVARIEHLELENRKLIETNSSLETAQNLHEEDVKTERDDLNQLVFYWLFVCMYTADSTFFRNTVLG